MGHVNQPHLYRAISVGLLGLLIIATSFAANAGASTACTAEARKAKDGAYEGCEVKIGNRQFTIAATQSSEDGCSQVCSIMAEVGGARPRSGNSARAETPLYRP